MRFKQATTDDTDESNDTRAPTSLCIKLRRSRGVAREIRVSNDEGMTKQPASPRLSHGARMNTNWKEQEITDLKLARRYPSRLYLLSP
jgi:hypothetical protein